MCFFCCVTLRGATYFMVTVHMVGTFALFLLSIELFVWPPNYPDINLSPLIVSQLPLILAGYSLLASFFACFIFRAVDMESVMQLKWSGLGFSVYQTLILFVQLLFSIMFGDIMNKTGQGIFAGLLVLNFLCSLIYLTVLFLYGKQLHDLKYGGPKLYRNSFGQGQQSQQLGNNWGVTHLPTLYTKDHNIPNLNFLQNHPPATRTNSVCVSISTGTNTEEIDLDLDNVLNEVREGQREEEEGQRSRSGSVSSTRSTVSEEGHTGQSGRTTRTASTVTLVEGTEP